LINLQVSQGKIACALVDTGFNGYLLWECRTDDFSDFPGEVSPLFESVEVAGGTILAGLAVADIHWLGEEDVYIRVEALVSSSAKETESADPVAFVGTALLSGMTLLVDFLEATLRIERST
jgi:predicted aspartyl protease